MDEFMEQDGFVVDTDTKANWCLKKIKEAIDDADRLKKIIADERAELDAKEKAINEKLEHETSYLKGLLFMYFGTVAHKATKTTESYKLLDGSLIYKKPVAKIVKPAEDDAELIKYLEETAPMLVETIKKPAWGEFKKNLTLTDDGVFDTTTGEKLDFIKTEESEGSFDIKVG